jgi:ribosome-associated toxin RatA of RatAB toxin-antitoxin module
MADHAHGSITINAAPKVVMAAIVDIPAYPTWSPPILATEVLEVGPDGRPKRARFHVDVVIAKDEYVLEYTWNGDESVSWELVEGKAQTAQEGRYALRDTGDGGTEVDYDLTVELKIKVPGILRRKVQSGVIDAALKDLKKHVES